MIAYYRTQIDSVFKFCGNSLDKEDTVYFVSYDIEINSVSVFNELSANFEKVIPIEGNLHTILSPFSKDNKLVIRINLD